MTDGHIARQVKAERIIVAVLFGAAGLLIVAVFSPWQPLLSGLMDTLGRVAVMISLLTAALLVRRSPRLNRYWRLLYGLFVLAAAVSADWFAASALIRMSVLDPGAPMGMAFQKLADGIVISAVVLLLTRISGDSIGSIYVQKGHLRRGIIVGMVTFCMAAATSVPIAQLMFRAQNLTMSRMLPWIPWILIFILASATDEEIMFRGLFLRKLEPFFGPFMANCLIALVFTGLHAAVTYTSSQMGFLAVLLPLALAWGYVMQKTDAVWGSILFHAGMDIPIVLGLFSTAS
ncbi:MAG TPA: CPBP family intramembrane glutamic endopeptidase [Clostridia bacterium]|nr:CPBP family intramembrane glutamic endopeptidase [Clostridia bacterium]